MTVILLGNYGMEIICLVLELGSTSRIWLVRMGQWWIQGGGSYGGGAPVPFPIYLPPPYMCYSHISLPTLLQT